MTGARFLGGIQVSFSGAAVEKNSGDNTALLKRREF